MTSGEKQSAQKLEFWGHVSVILVFAKSMVVFLYNWLERTGLQFANLKGHIRASVVGVFREYSTLSLCVSSTGSRSL
jgi:hypothetical protein